MDKNRAKELLNIQCTKLHNQIGIEIKDAWLNQTRSYIAEFFGVESEEYKYISSFSLNYHIDEVTKEVFHSTYNHQAQLVQTFLQRCIETLEVKRMYKKPQINYLQKFNNKEIAGIIAGLLATAFSIGVWVGYTNFKLDYYEKIRAATVPNPVIH